MDINGVVFLPLCLVLLRVAGVQSFREPFSGQPDEELIATIKKSSRYINDMKRLKPGQSMPNLCAYSEHGCCTDQKTFAEGENFKGCAVKLCIDKHVRFCHTKKLRRRLYCGERMPDSRRCPYSCGHCRTPAQPIKKCLRENPVYGCCWDGTIPIGKYGRGCRPCEDIHKNPCAIFKRIAGGCESGSLGIRTFMVKYCPLSCRICEEANFSQLRQARRRHHRRRPDGRQQRGRRSIN